MEGLDGVYISCDGSFFVGLVVLMDRYWLCVGGNGMGLGEGEKRQRYEGRGGGRGGGKARERKGQEMNTRSGCGCGVCCVIWSSGRFGELNP